MLAYTDMNIFRKLVDFRQYNVLPGGPQDTCKSEEKNRRGAEGGGGVAAVGHVLIIS